MQKLSAFVIMCFLGIAIAMPAVAAESGLQKTGESVQNLNSTTAEKISGAGTPVPTANEKSSKSASGQKKFSKNKGWRRAHSPFDRRGKSSKN